MVSRLCVSQLRALQCVLIRNSVIVRAPSPSTVNNECHDTPISKRYFRSAILKTQSPSIDKHIGGRPWNPDLNRNYGSTHVSSNKKEISDLEEVFKVLKMKLERLGQLNIDDINRALRTLDHHWEELTDDDCLKLLHFTIRMVEDEYRPCVDTVQHVWMMCTKRSEANLTLEHFELYLRACLLAEPTCASEARTDISSLLEKHQLEPSREVIELMILLLGRQGDLAGATSLLTYMKQRNLPVTETIFSALIMAHGINNDSKGIESVYDAIRSIQMTPTNITYEAMITSYGISGQILQMKQMVSQMKQARVTLTHSQFTSVLLNLVKSGQAGMDFENIDYVVELMEESDSRVDLSRVVLQMIHLGRVQEGVHLLPTFPQICSSNHLYSNALVYVREMVYAEVEPGLLVEMCEELKNKEINLYALQVALEYALREKKEKLAWPLLRAIKESGSPLRQHYFWPLFHMNAVASESSKLLECAREMIEMGENPSLETLRDHIIPGLTINHPALTMKMLRRVGLTAAMCATPLLIVLIRNRMFKQAIAFVKETQVPFSLRDLTSTLAGAWSYSPRAIISLLALLINKNRKNMTENEFAEEDWGGQFLLDLAASRTGLNNEQIRPIFEELRKNKIGISEMSADLLLTRSNKSIQQAIRNNISLILNSKMGQPPKEQEYNILPHPKSMTVEELDGHMVELQAKSLNVRGTFRKLLLQHAANNETAKVLNLMKKAKEDEIKLSPGMIASILMAYINNKNVEGAMDMYSVIQVEHPSFALDSYKVVDLCTLLVENGRSQEALAVLKEYSDMEIKKTVITKQIRRNCQNLLVAAASTCNYDLTQELFNMLIAGGLLEPDNLALGTLVKCRLNSGDLRGAVKEVEIIYKSYKSLPMRIEILIHLIHHTKCLSEKVNISAVSSKGNAATATDLLEHMVNIIALCHGPRHAKHDLMFACLEAGQPVEARKVLQSLGQELDVKLLNRQFDRYSKMERDDPLLHFLAASRGNNSINRQQIFSSLLNIYYIQSAGDKGLSLWTMMQEEDLTPSEPFLSTLASLLASNNMKIPFQIQ